MEFPQIYLAIDNCFASKRWTSPDEWMEIISKSGASCIEASADTECDPLYSDTEYLKDWIKNVEMESKKNGTSISNFYSGHGTYSTIGLAHTDERCRNKFVYEWMLPLIDNASRLGAGVGFYCHAFKESFLQDPEIYAKEKENLYSRFEIIANYAKTKNVIIGVEQMYTPHQYPWRIADCHEILKEFKQRGCPLYITIDVGHQYGQKRFLLPSREDIISAIESKLPIYAGPYKAYELQLAAISGKINSEDVADQILEISKGYPHLFAKEEDTLIYEWLSQLACYSPIIHLQQTDNTSSAHKDFTEDNNTTGLINPMEVLESIYQSYMLPQTDDMPPRADKIYLTLEFFYGTAEYNFKILENIKESISYWRKYIPEDGISLDKLLSKMK